MNPAKPVGQGAPPYAGRVRNDWFDPSIGFERGRSRLTMVLWYGCKVVFFLTAFPWPSRFKAALLRCFGATVGKGVVIKPRVNVQFPWKLSIGAHTWIGEEVILLNFEPIHIGSHACLSQRVFVCAGNHDFRAPAMTYRNKRIVIEDGVWLAAQCFVGPGTTIHAEAVALAGSIVTSSLPPAMVCGGNPCIPIGPRWKA